MFSSVKEQFLDDDGFPAVKPPWGKITAMNLNTGKIIWQVPFGDFPNSNKMYSKQTGDYNRSGLTATRGNLIFAAGTRDNKIRAFNSINGQELWSNNLPSPGSSAPTIYEINNKQYVLISTFENGGNTILSYTLKN